MKHINIIRLLNEPNIHRLSCKVIRYICLDYEIPWKASYVYLHKEKISYHRCSIICCSHCTFSK